MSARSSVTLELLSEQETAAFARALAPLLQPGDTLLLAGQIGAGKTHFARAVIRTRLAAAGLEEDVPSPTFTLIQTYDDGLTELWHADLYRLSTPEEVHELGLEEAFETAVCLVEWPDRLGDQAPKNALRIDIQHGSSDTARILTIEAQRGEWHERLRAMLGQVEDCS